MEQKGANIQRGALHVLQVAWRTIPECNLKKLHDGLSQRVQAMLWSCYMVCFHLCLHMFHTTPLYIFSTLIEKYEETNYYVYIFNVAFF